MGNSRIAIGMKQGARSLENFHIKGFLETSFVDWRGMITALIFLPSCNFRCPYCHNHPLVLSPQNYRDIPLVSILTKLDTLKGWVDGVTISGGEPTLCNDLPILISSFKKEGFKVKLDTNGSNPSVIRSLIEEELIDYVAMDIKSPLRDLSYRKAAGVVVDLQKIKDSITILQEGKVDYEFRTTIVPSLHTEDDIFSIARELKGSKRWTLQNLRHQDTLNPLLDQISPFPEEQLLALEQKAKKIMESPLDNPSQVFS